MDANPLLARLERFWSQADSWFTANVLSAGTGYQAGLMVLAAGLAVLAHRLLYPRAEASLRDLQVPSPVRRLLHAGASLIGIAVFLILALATDGIVRDQMPEIGTKLVTICISLATAWAIIRISASLIANRPLARAIAWMAWIAAALEVVGLLQPLIRALNAVGISMGTTRVTLWGVAKAIGLMAILLWATFFASALIAQRLQAAAVVTPRTQVLLLKIMKGVLIVAAGAIALSAIGIDLAALAVFAGALGVGIGLGLQNQVSNLLSGLFLLLDKSIKPGDVIEVGGTYGWVREMSARYIGVVTRDNKEYLIPNDTFIREQVINWSHSDRTVRLEVKFSVAYDADPPRVRELAADAARKSKRVAIQPAPLCHMLGFGNGTIDFVLRFWISDPENGVINIKGEVLLALWLALKENGIRVPLPLREVVTADGARAASRA